MLLTCSAVQQMRPWSVLLLFVNAFYIQYSDYTMRKDFQGLLSDDSSWMSS